MLGTLGGIFWATFRVSLDVYHFPTTPSVYHCKVGRGSVATVWMEKDHGSDLWCSARGRADKGRSARGRLRLSSSLLSRVYKRPLSLLRFKGKVGSITRLNRRHGDRNPDPETWLQWLAVGTQISHCKIYETCFLSRFKQLSTTKGVLLTVHSTSFFRTIKFERHRQRR